MREENLTTTLPLKGVEVRGRHWRDIRGDKVALKDYPSAGFEPMGVPATPMFERGCEISRVVPMARDERRIPARACPER